MANWKFWQKPDFEDSELPEEVKEYYESTQNQSRTKNLLVSLGTVLVTLLIAYGVFVTGRFIYNKFYTEPTQPTDISEVVTPGGDTAIDNKQDNGAKGDDLQNPATDEEINSNNGGDIAVGGGSSERDSQGSAPNTGSVPNTGPGNLVAIFALTTIASTLAYSRLQKARLTN